MLTLRHSIVLSLLLGSLIFILTPGRSYSESTPLISMDFQNANLKDVLKVFSQQSGLNFIASEDVKDRKLTLYFEKVPVQDALNTIISANNLAYTQVEGTNIFIVKESEEVKVKTVTQIFPLKYARVSKFGTEGEEEGKGETAGIKLAVEKLLSEKGRVADDLRTNSLIVIDIPSQLKVIEEAIAKLDVPTPQVMIEVEIVDATKRAVDSLGIEWSGTFGTYTGPIRETLYPFSQIFPPGPHGWDKATTTTVAKLDMSGLTATLKALTTDTNTKYLARPRILTLSNESAQIKITTDEAIGLTTSTSTTGDVGTVTKEAERVETGISLKVTPQVNAEEGVITMLIEPSVSEAVTGGTFDGTTFKDPETRSTKTTVRLKDGETIVIGGLIRKKSSETIKKIPLLGDIPGLGVLFRHRERTEPNDRELIVFITPHIIKETEAQPAKLPEEVTPEEVRKIEAKRLTELKEREERLKQEAEEKARREEEQAKLRAQREEELRLKQEEKVRREAERKTQLEAERLAKEEASLKAEKEREERLKRIAEEKAQREEELRLKREEEARLKEERLKREAELRAKYEEEIAKLRAQREEWERKRREAREEERRLKAEEEVRKIEAKRLTELKEREERLKQEAEEKARREEEQARLRAQCEEESRLKREEEARRKEEARLKAEQEKEERLKRISEEKAKREEERRLKAEEEARKREEKRLAELREKEERLKKEAEDKARREEEARLRAQCEEELRLKREEEARRKEEARLKAEQEKEERLKRLAEEKARREEEQARLRAQCEEESRLKREEEACKKEEARLKAEQKEEEERLIKRIEEVEAQLAKLPEEVEERYLWSRQDEIEAMLDQLEKR